MDNFSTQLADIASTCATDTIFICGKGPSIDEIDKRIFAGNLIIALNDAECIHPADISIFHADWVRNSLAANGWKSRLYITPKEIDVAGVRSVTAPHVKLTQATSDLIMQRFTTDRIYIEDILLLTALKVARRIAQIRRREMTVYMVGFDFSSELGYSQAISVDYSGSSQEDKAAKISIQQFFFMNALYFLRTSEIRVRHIGHRSFSVARPAELNLQLLGRSVVAGPNEERPDRVAIVAELTSNHFGDRSRLEAMIRAAKAAGADYVKLQKRDVETFYTPDQLASPYVSPFGATFGDYRRALELNEEDFAFVDTLCRDIGIAWFASVLDEPSFHFMLQFVPQIVKLPSTISEHRHYIETIARTYSGAVVLSTGMTDEAYEAFVLEAFAGCSKLYLMQANSAYPTPLEDCGVGVVRRYHELSCRNSRIVPAYSSHDIGSKGSMLAVAAGARMVEKHVKLGNTDWAHFDAVAVDLSTDAFREYVQDVREAELIVGIDKKTVKQSEHHKYFRNVAA